MDTPDAKPSKPSIKFTAFVIAKIHNKVSGKLNQRKSIIPTTGNVTKSIRIPATK